VTAEIEDFLVCHVLGRPRRHNIYIIRFVASQRTIIIRSNHRGVPGPRIRAVRSWKSSSGD
jgi:hypothetical protein